MTPTETTTILRCSTNGAEATKIPQPDLRVIGEAIDAAVEMIDRPKRLRKNAELRSSNEVPHKPDRAN